MHVYRGSHRVRGNITCLSTELCLNSFEGQFDSLRQSPRTIVCRGDAISVGKLICLQYVHDQFTSAQRRQCCAKTGRSSETSTCATSTWGSSVFSENLTFNNRPSSVLICTLRPN